MVESTTKNTKLVGQIPGKRDYVTYLDHLGV